MRNLIAAVVGLACVLALSSLGDAERPGVPEVPDGQLAVTADGGETVVLRQSDDYTLFIDAIEGVIQDNGDAVATALSSADASRNLAALQQAGQRNDAAAAAGNGAGDSAAAPAAAGSATLTMGSQVIPYVSSHLSVSAPESTAGLWNGSDSTTDGRWGYFVGHNPGVFSCMLAMGNGSSVTVTDGAGAARTYTVLKVFDVPNTATWRDVSDTVTGYGESIVLQTCIDGGNRYRIMVAA